MAEPQPPQDQPIDLSSLEGLTLGTAWSPSGSRSAAPSEPRSETSRPPRQGFRPSKPGENRYRRPNERPTAPAIEPPSLKVIFYPEEAPFKALTKAIRASKRTYELFEISRLILEKPERTTITLSKIPNADGKSDPLFVATGDGAVFLTEAEALEYACAKSIDKFFKIEEVEVDPPKGNFVVIHRCGITGKLIAPPNYHKYAQLLNKHHAQNLPTMSLAAVQARLESVKEPELIAQWVESMKKTTRYTVLPQNTQAEGAKADAPVSFEGIEAAIEYLAAHHKEELVKSVAHTRLNHKQAETLPKGEIRRSIDAARALQMKFPLDTANTLRGRLRRMEFNLYKQGPKGVSYLSVVKRKFRILGQTFAPEVQQMIECIEKNPNILDAELPKQMLGITPPPPAAPGAEAKNTLSPDEDAALKKLRQTLQWLVEEGYVIHYGNGRLFVPPARRPNAPKNKDMEEEIDENIETPAAEEPGENLETPPPTPPTA